MRGGEGFRRFDMTKVAVAIICSGYFFAQKIPSRKYKQLGFYLLFFFFAQENAPYDCEVLENTKTEREERHIVEVNAELVADEDKQRRKYRVHEKARYEYARIKPAVAERPKPAEYRVKRCEEPHRKKTRVAERHEYGAKRAKHETDDESRYRKYHDDAPSAARAYLYDVLP